MNALPYLQYGKALYRAASQLGKEVVVFEQLETFADKQLEEAIKKLSMLESSRIEIVLTKTFEGKVDKLLFNLLILLARKRKLTLLKKVFQAYKELYYRATGKQEIVLRTARKLEIDEQKTYEKLFSTKNNHTVVRFETNPALLAGVQVCERGYVTDYSLQNYLLALKKNISARD